MPQPTAYSPSTNFAADELANAGGRSTVRTADVDAEFSAIATTLSGVRTNLALNQRDDGEIRDERVKLHTLSTDVKALLAAGQGLPRGAWLTATAYALRDIVTQSGSSYICATAHTSGTFATDLAAARWMLLALGSSTSAASIPFSATGTLSATNVQAAIEEADTENRTLSAAASAEVTALAGDIANSSTASKGAGQVGFGYGIYSPAATVGAQVGHYINAAIYGAVSDSSTNNTSAVQAALNALGATGGVVQVDPGARFNLQSLTFPQRSNLEFWMDDDLSRPNPSTTLGTNERVLFQANANSGGIVNEHRVTAAFHPSLNIDVRRDVAGHDAHLGAGQVRVPTSSSPARASWNIFDQQVDAFRTAYEIFGGDYSLFSGVTSHGWRRTVTITGVGTGAGGFVSVPAVGTEVTGTVSGAKGWFLSATTTTTTLLWNSGKFAASDRLTDNNETTANAASSVAFAIEPLQSFGQDLRRGNWSFGLPVGAGTDLLSVGGRVALLPTRTFSQYVDKTITHPGLVLSDLVSDVPTNGFVIHYDTTAAAASRRLTVRKISGAVEATTDSAHVNACRAHCNFGNAGGVSSSAFNVASVTRTGTGRYAIVFTRAMERDDYSVSISLEEGSTKGGYPLSKTTSGFTLAVATLGGTTAVDLAAAASVVVFGGDI